MTGIGTRRVLIPAAGFGKRVGSPPAKELFPHPRTDKPLIQSALACAQEAGARALVISRHDKTALNNYVQSEGSADLFLIDSSLEWPDSLLQSKEYWLEHNLIILPDTSFEPQSVVVDCFEKLESESEVVFATFKAEDLSQWGAVRPHHNLLIHCEKPHRETWSSVDRIWGLFGFRREHGSALLSSLLQSTRDGLWKTLPIPAHFMALEEFSDLTR